MKLKHVITTLGLAVVMAFGVGAGLKAGHREAAKAATSTTVYCAISSATLGTYSLKLNTNQQTNPDSWHQYDMVSAGTYGDLLLYSCTYTDLWDGVDTMQFQLYDGSTWKDQKVAISSWTAASNYNGKTYLYDESAWEIDPTTLRVVFATDVPDYVDIYIPGAFNSWAGDNSSKMTRDPSDDKVFTYSARVAAGTYLYKLEACYASKGFEWLDNIDEENASVTIAAGDIGTTKTIRTNVTVPSMPLDTVADGAVVQLTMSTRVDASINLYFAGVLTGWADTAGELASALMTPNAGRTVFTWAIPAETTVGATQFKIVAMYANGGATAASYDYIVYANGDNNASITLDTSTVTYALESNSDLSELGAIAFSKDFLKAMATPCADQDADNESAVSAIWTTWSTAFAALTDGAKTQFRTNDNTDVSNARGLYLHVVARYKLASWGEDAPTTMTSLSVLNNNVDGTMIIVIISSIAVLATAGFFFIRRRKEER